jgi:hypothetical protein
MDDLYYGQDTFLVPFGAKAERFRPAFTRVANLFRFNIA